jgi:hypothetical protein
MIAADRHAPWQGTPWQTVYTTKNETGVSWFQDNPTIAHGPITAAGAGRDRAATTPADGWAGGAAAPISRP